MINHVHEKLTPCVLNAYVMVPELHRVKLEDLRTTHLCKAFEMLLSAIIGRIIVMVTKINNEGDDKPWVSSTKAIINDPISALQWLTFLKRITVWVLEVRMKMLLLRKRGGRYVILG